MSTRSTIVVAVDGSAESDAAVAWAARECSLRHAPVTLMHVISPVVVSVPVEPMFVPPEWYERRARHVLRHAERDFASSWTDPGPADLRLVIEHGGVVDSLASASEQALMVVIGNRGADVNGRFTLGSVSAGLLHRAACPVVVIRADQPIARADAPVALGVDGSPASEAAIAMAFDESSRRGVDLVAMHAWSDTEIHRLLDTDRLDYGTQGREVLAERLAGWQERFPDVHVRRRVVCDRPTHSLIEESRRAQLVVVGNRGRGALASTLLGSTSSALALHSSAPVMVVPAH